MNEVKKNLSKWMYWFLLAVAVILVYKFLDNFTAIGYAIGMFKVPETNGLEIFRKTGGENIDDVIKRYIKFKKNRKKLYVYTKEENLNG